MIVGQKQLEQYGAIRRMESSAAAALGQYNRESSDAWEGHMGDTLRRKLDDAATRLDVQMCLIFADYNRSMGRPF